MEQITCKLVKVKKVVPNNRKASRLAIRNQIECGEWYFPCKDYKYKSIKAGLENAIKEVLDVKEIVLRRFSTNIVEFDPDDVERICW